MVVLLNSNTNNLTANKEKSCSACHFNCISETQKPVYGYGIVSDPSLYVVPNGGHFGNRSNNIKFFLSDGSSAGSNIQQYKFLKMLRSSYLKNYRLKIITCCRRLRRRFMMMTCKILKWFFVTTAKPP